MNRYTPPTISQLEEICRTADCFRGHLVDQIPGAHVTDKGNIVIDGVLFTPAGEPFECECQYLPTKVAVFGKFESELGECFLTLLVRFPYSIEYLLAWESDPATCARLERGNVHCEWRKPILIEANF